MAFNLFLRSCRLNDGLPKCVLLILCICTKADPAGASRPAPLLGLARRHMRSLRGRPQESKGTDALLPPASVPLSCHRELSR